MHWCSLSARRIFLSLFVTCLFGPLVLPNRVRGAETTNSPARWEKDILVFEAADKTNPPPKQAILFIGSSSIRLWQTIAHDFAEHKIINRGFGGSQIADSTHFAERIVIPYEPRLIAMYAGGNDINAGKTPERVAADFKAFVGTVHAKLPNTRIAYISIAPNPARWAQVERVKATNALVAEYTKQNPKLQFIDVFPHMLGPDGRPRPEIFVEDKLHMNANGYALWTKIVKPYLTPSAKDR